MYDLRHLVWWKRHSLIEKRAGQIADPVERLRYLRQNAQVQPAPPSLAQSLNYWKERRNWIVLSLTVFVFLASIPGHTNSRTSTEKTPGPRLLPPSMRTNAFALDRSKPSAVWLVDTRGGTENFSNGLRIDNTYAVRNEPRTDYPIYGYGKIDEGIVSRGSVPVGIVYHTTESHLAPFEARENHKLQLIGQAVLEYVRGNRSYHFVIDRFGRVYRIVQESDIAFHAGNSVWGDDKGAYVNLNSSFLGVAFETATGGNEIPTATPAQITSARVLTEMLRSKYGIPAANCVTHAQVSVNPGNMLIGYHTDWAGSFPFSELGLPDNYLLPPPSMYAFGFGYDGIYVQVTGNRVWQGLLMAEDQVQRQAATAAMPVPKYIAVLQHRYRQIIAVLKSKSPGKEKGDEA